MCAHDRTADRQAQARAARLGGEKWIEQLRNRSGIHARAAISHHELDIAFAVDPRAQHDLALCFRNLLHRVDTVAHQVEDHLLHLHGIGLHLRHVSRWFQFDAHAVMTRVGLCQHLHIVEQPIGIHQLAAHFAILDETAQAANDFTGTQSLRADLLQRRVYFVLLNLAAGDQTLTGLRVGRNRRQRLIHFVGDARRHFAHRGDASEVRDAILHLSRFVFGATPIGNVVQRADLPQGAAVRTACGLRDVMHISQRAIRMSDAVFDIRGARAGTEFIACPLPARTIRRVHHRFEIVVNANVAFAISTAEHAIQMRRPVVLELAVEVHDIVAKVCDLLRDRELRFAAPQSFLGIATHGDIANETDEARRIGALHPANRQFGGKLAAVAALRQQLAANADDARLARFDVMPQVVLMLRTVRFGQQDVDLESDHVLFVVAEHAFARMIEQIDAAFVIEQHDRIDSRVEHCLEFALQALGALFLGLGDSKEGHGLILNRPTGLLATGRTDRKRSCGQWPVGQRPVAFSILCAHMDCATVLLIDGNPEDEQLIREELALIRDTPYQLERVTTFAEGLARIKKGRIDVILIDLNLPDSLGLTTFLRLQPKASHYPIIVLVGQADEDLGVEAVERGALDYLIKQQVVSNLLGKALRYATERTHTLLALKASETRYRELYENVVAGVFQTTPDGKFMAANPALVRLLGYDSEDELLDLSIAPDLYMYQEERDNWMRSMAASGEIRNAELVLKRKDGRRIVVLENSRAVRDEHGQILYYEGTLTDITEAHELSRQLSYEASHDALTGLINRREFELRLQGALDSVQASGATHAMCYLDLDQFKIINDTCGHVAGDELLRQLAQTLQGRVRSNDTLARLGGDEFGLLLHDCAPEDAMAVAAGLLKAVEQHQFVWGSNTFSVGASIGLVPVGTGLRRITQVLQAADAACYAAKDQGRNRIHVYQEDDTVVSQRHGEMQWVARVKRALNENRFFLEAQPIVPIGGDGRDLRNYELLVRMRDESGRVVPPGAFLPSVERYNLSQRLDRWVITTALQWLAAHREQTERIARVFVNLSGDSVGDPQLQEFIHQLLQETQVSPARLGFEITETAAISNLTRANQLIAGLRKTGCAFALDDFGSGVSSFAYLKALTVDFLKIDGLFIGNIINDPIDLEMVRSITDIGHVMGKKVVAESVESLHVLEKLREIGVDYAQGFAVGAPGALENIGMKEIGIRDRGTVR